jgi:hypothetical protein
VNVQEAPIAKPCPARWDRMEGTDRARFCRECRQTVYDLSAMTEPEARSFVAANPTACRRYTYDGRTGLILHRGAGCGTARVRIATRKTGAIAALSLALAGPAQASVTADVDTGWFAWARDTVESYAHSAAVWLGLADADPRPVVEPMILGGAPPPMPVEVQVQGEAPMEPRVLGGKPAPPPDRRGE